MVSRRGGWAEDIWLQTHADIVATAAKLRNDGTRVTLKAVADGAGVTRKTVSRHFPRLADALLLAPCQITLGHFLDALKNQPGDGPALHLLLDTAIEAAVYHFGDPEFVRTKSLALIESPANLMVAQDAFRREAEPRLIEALAARAGRLEPTMEDHTAAGVISTVAMLALATWAKEGHTRSLADVWRDIAAILGHKP